MSREGAAAIDSGYLWIQVCEQLKWHSKGNHTCIDTLNRLWQKHTDGNAKNDETLLELPTLTVDMITVTIEQWTLADLVALNDKRNHKRAQPAAFPPILVLTWNSRDSLIDGGNRINFWAKAEIVGPHAVLRMTTSRDI